MNKIKTFIGLALLGFVFYACVKEQVVQTESVEFKSTPYWVEDGVLNFNTGKDYEELNDRLSMMSPTEIQRWEDSLGFISFNSEYFAFLNQLDSIKNEEQFYNFIIKNNDIVFLEDSTIIPLIWQSSHQRTVNRNGYVIINNILIKVTSNEMLINDTFCSDSIKMDKSSNWTRRVEIEKPLQLKSTYCGSIVNQTGQSVDNKWCFAEYSVYSKGYPLSGTDMKYCYEVNCISYAYKKSFGITVLYNSLHACTGLECVVEAPVYDCICGCYNYIEQKLEMSAVGPTTTTLKTYAWFNGQRIGEYVLNTILPQPEFKRVKGRFWISGTTNPEPPYNHEDAVVNCGYGY